MEVDHLIPESLLSDSAKLAAARKALGLPNDFEINSYANWLPTCRSCNRLKSDALFKPSLEIQLLIQKASASSARAGSLAQKVVSSQKITKALGVLASAAEQGKLSPEAKSALLPLVYMQTLARLSRMDEHPIRLKPDFVIPAHRFSSSHREGLLVSKECGCFYCLRQFLPDEIVDWTDGEETAICPHCGIDAVIGDISGYEITPYFLLMMREHWFGAPEFDSPELDQA